MKKILLISFVSLMFVSAKCQDTLVYYSQAEYSELQYKIDSLQIYKDSVKYLNSQLDYQSPYFVDGYNVQVNFADSLGNIYDFTQRDKNAWLRMTLEDGSRVNMWKLDNAIEFWYGKEFEAQKVFYFDLEWFK